jgi:ketosteroid isomerase-like protein
MSQHNVEVVRRIYEAWNEGGDFLPALRPHFSEEIEWVNPDYAVEPGTRHGYQGLEAVMQGVDAAFVHYTHTPVEFLDTEDSVLACVVFEAKGRDSGIEVRVDEQHLWTFSGKKVVRFEWFHNRSDALAAIGLSEQGDRADA